MVTVRLRLRSVYRIGVFSDEGLMLDSPPWVRVRATTGNKHVVETCRSSVLKRSSFTADQGK
jgi:hypothetical protein